MAASAPPGTWTRNRHRAVVVDVDLGAGLVLDRANHLAARANHRADLLRVDLDPVHLRRELRKLLARRGDRLKHLAKDVLPALMRLAAAPGA